MPSSSKVIVLFATCLIGFLPRYFVSTAGAEVAFPQARASVGIDEYYELDAFDNWTVYCLRDTNSEDMCEATSYIADHSVGIQLEFSVVPIIDFSEPVPVTVDVAPRAVVSITTNSQAPQYEELIASIASLDGVHFDGYSCTLKNLDECAQGPELVLQDTRMITSAEVAVVEITRAGTAERVAEIEVSLSSLSDAYNRANNFNAEVFGVDLTDTRNIGEMCNFTDEGTERRISYFLDQDSNFSKPSRREDWLGARGNTTCPSYVVLSYFTPDMTPAQRKLFCLVFDEDGGEYLGAALGEGDQYRVCRTPSKTVCERVNDSKNAALATVGAATAITGGAAAATTATGVSVVTHSSGLAILTGGAGYISGTIGPLAAAISTLTAPITLAAAAVTVVGVGGAVYVCRERDDVSDNN